MATTPRVVHRAVLGLSSKPKQLRSAGGAAGAVEGGDDREGRALLPE